MLLEALETAPEQRKKGYATALIRAALAQVGTVKIYSHVGKRNEASLKTHISCGFRRISEQAVYADGSVNDRCCTLLYEGNL
jgi:RimJ/RimL family protein N-acetyltransferase